MRHSVTPRRPRLLLRLIELAELVEMFRLRCNTLFTSLTRPRSRSPVQLMKNPEVLELFDDKEVMAAVGEIGKNPAAAKKYEKNEKVQRMYRFMAQQAAERMYALAESNPNP